MKKYFLNIALTLFVGLLIIPESYSEVPLVLCQNEYLNLDEDLLVDRLSCIENLVPLPYNRRVSGFIDYFIRRDRAYTQAVMNAQELYFPIFEEALERHGLPDELKYLAIVESGLNPKAVSPAYAVGLWQFMNSTGRSYGLKADILIDDRMDPFLATEAACKYLKFLHGMFNDWPLALAAYNCGPGNVRRAIRRSGYKKDFWEVYRYLPRETRSYVPQFIAITYVFNYAEEHMLFPDNSQYFPEYKEIVVNQNLSLNALAAELGLCIDDLRKLNPQLKKDVVPMHRKEYSFRIPAIAYEKFESNSELILKNSEKLTEEEIVLIAQVDRLSPFGKEKHYHKVRSGDVLGIIAEKYHVRVSDIKRWNNLHSNTIRVGQNLVIWKVPGYVPASTTQYAKTIQPKSPIPADKVYLVKYGDTLWDISRKFEGLSIEKIKKLNNLSSNTIKPGMKLRIG
ncbi:MAG: LysM peptidoglycan-binding domain-containing protein [Cytophagales bacterium]